MGVLKRFGNIMSCKVNSLLNKSKNPLKDVDKYIALLESQLGEIKAEKERISEKENWIDIDMDNLSTELEAINTEIQSVKSLVDDAISSVFDWGSG